MPLGVLQLQLRIQLFHLCTLLAPCLLVIQGVMPMAVYASWSRNGPAMGADCVEYRLVMNKASQQPKGTAFVEYWDTLAAAAAAAACQKARYSHLPLFQPSKSQPPNPAWQYCAHCCVVMLSCNDCLEEPVTDLLTCLSVTYGIGRGVLGASWLGAALLRWIWPCLRTMLATWPLVAAPLLLAKTTGTSTW